MRTTINLDLPDGYEPLYTIDGKCIIAQTSVPSSKMHHYDPDDYYMYITAEVDYEDVKRRIDAQISALKVPDAK